MKKCVFVIITILISLNACSSNTDKQPYLKEEFKDNYLMGTALNYPQIMGEDTQTIELIKTHFNSITPENVLKWEVVHPTIDNYNFDPSDNFVDFGIDNEMFVIGHVLVWHSQTPNWVFHDDEGKLVDKKTLELRMKDHIFEVAGRYKGKINGWDVVNEAIEDNGDFRRSHWFNIIGEEFIEKAFIWAHEAAPNCELYYNDYNMWQPGKVEAVVNLVKKMQKKGIKIDGVGIQAHWGLDYPEIGLAEAAIEAYSKLGLKVMITELDMAVLPFPGENVGAEISKNVEYQKKFNPYPDDLPSAKKIELAVRYADFFSLFNKYSSSISRVTFWGTHDGMSWRNNWPIPGRTAYPLIFDRKLKPKLAFDHIIETTSK